MAVHTVTNDAVRILHCLPRNAADHIERTLCEHRAHVCNGWEHPFIVNELEFPYARGVSFDLSLVNDARGTSHSDPLQDGLAAERVNTTAHR